MSLLQVWILKIKDLFGKFYSVKFNNLETRKDLAIILTTHSMEEADYLSDRIGIITKG